MNRIASVGDSLNREMSPCERRMKGHDEKEERKKDDGVKGGRSEDTVWIHCIEG